MTLTTLTTLPLAAGAPGQGTAPLLITLATILCVAAVTTVLFQKIRQPVILGYLLAGLIVGPHLPVPLVADTGLAHIYSELGVILLMYAMGMEFSLRKLARVATTAGIIAVVQCSLMIWLGYLVGTLFGWTRYECLFAGALIAISSTTIIVKAFAEQNIKGHVTEVVFGVLIVEDLIAILLLAILTSVATGAGLSAGSLAQIAGRLGGLLAVILIAGLFIVPRLMRMIVRVGRPETIVVANIGVCFAFALLAEKLGYSVALGAFVGGALVAESGEGHTIEPLVAPVRDVFAAVFFVAVGMQIDPKLVAEHWVPVVVLTAVVVVGKLVGVTIGAFFAGTGVRVAVQSGLSLAQIGEFSFIIAGVGAALGATRSFLYPVAVAVSAITTLITPWLIRAGGPVSEFVDRRMPPALATYTSLYASWVERLRGPTERAAISRARRTAGLLVIDVSVIAGIVIAAATVFPRLIANIMARVGLSQGVARALALTALTAIALPFVRGAMRMARALGAALASEALPTGAGVDLAAAPRRGFVVGLQLTILALLGIPLTAAIQPFVPLGATLVVLVLVLVLVGVRLWRTAANLQAHARAGAQVITELLAAEARSGDAGADALAAARHMIPGLGEPEIVRLTTTSPALGRTLKTLNLRGLTGATVVALQPATSPAVVPTGDEELAAGDIVVLAGSTEAVQAARAILERAPIVTPSPTFAAPGL
jgi:CPA2 family monovalent cation:H+ antiporter-2